jgi:hypothetical protein
MTIPADAQRDMDAYLAALRKRLRPLAASDAQEILDEIRSHILDKTAAQGAMNPESLAATLAALGSPEALAGDYVTNALLHRAQSSRSPFPLLRALFRWAGLSFAGFITLILSLIGYFIGGAFFLCALLKPFHPQSAGLWRIPDPHDPSSISLRLGFSLPPPGAHELLGWWIIPLGLFAGALLVLFTILLGSWSIRAFWKPRARNEISNR